MTALILHFHCFNDLYIKIFPTMLRIGRSRIHHCYLPFSLAPAASERFLVARCCCCSCCCYWHTRFPFLAAFSFALLRSGL